MTTNKMKPSQLLLLRSLAFNTPSSICSACIKRQFRTLQPLRQQPSEEPSPKPSAPKFPENPEDFVLKPLGRPIGSSFPPLPGDNDPVDHRPFAQRKADLTNWDRHLERRKELTKQISKPAFRDWKNLKYASGKGWIANERLWKNALSLWMPNLRGPTLDKVGDAEEGVGGMRDTAATFRGKISVVGIFSRTWAESQVKSFIGSGNPALLKLIEESGGRAQVVEINVEEAPLARWILKLFEYNIRRTRRPEDWGKYFFLSGIPDSVRECIGVTNSKAGYVYLVDTECKIRWAGSGDATEAEKESLVKGVSKLVEERKDAFEKMVKGKAPYGDFGSPVVKSKAVREG
jgi:ATPase complex subunit ATP10